MCFLLTDQGKLRIAVSCKKAVTVRGDSVLQARQFLNDILHASAFCLMLTRTCQKVYYSPVDCLPSNVYGQSTGSHGKDCLYLAMRMHYSLPYCAATAYRTADFFYHYLCRFHGQTYGERFDHTYLNLIIFTCSQWLYCLLEGRCHGQPHLQKFPSCFVQEKTQERRNKARCRGRLGI